MRSSAQEQRAAIVTAALTQLGLTGLDSTPVEVIARRAEVSPAYVHQLFGTKSDLMQTVIAEHSRLLTHSPPHDDDLGALCRQLHIWGAAHDDAVKEPVKDAFRIMWDEVAQTSCGADEARRLMADVVLRTVLTSLDLMDLYGQDNQ